MLPQEQLVKGSFRLLETDNRLILPPMAEGVALITSGDVIHSWAVPSLGVKMDAIPGRCNEVHLKILRQSVFYEQCSDLCGINRGYMPKVIKSIIKTKNLR